MKEINAGKLFRCSGRLATSSSSSNVYLNKDRTTTLGFANGGNREVFDEVKEKCVYSAKARFDLSMPRMDADALKRLTDFFAESEITVAHAETGKNYKLTRYQGKRGDAMTVKQ